MELDPEQLKKYTNWNEAGKEEERQMFQQMQAMAQKQVIIFSYTIFYLLFVFAFLLSHNIRKSQQKE